MQKKDSNPRTVFANRWRMFASTRNSTDFSGACSANLPWTWAFRRLPAGRRNKWQEWQQKPILPWNYLCGHVGITHTNHERNVRSVGLVITVKEESRRRSKSVTIHRLWKRARPANNGTGSRSSREISINNSCSEDATHSSTFREKKEKTEF